MSVSEIYILNVDFDELRAVYDQVRDAHDPLAFFGFEGRRYFDADSMSLKSYVVASKNGADAAYWRAILEERLHELGLMDALVVTEKPGG